MRWDRCSLPELRSRNTGIKNWTQICACRARTTVFNPGEWRQTGACTMVWRKVAIVIAVVIAIFASSQSAWTQSPTYGVGRTPTPEEIRAWDIAISPTGKELPQGHGTAKEGAALFVSKGCGGCHGASGSGGHAP